MPHRPHGGAILAGALAITVAPAARADLSDDADRLVKAWSDRGAAVTRLPAAFLERGRPRRLALAAPREGDPPCLTVAVIGVRTAEIVVTRDDPDRKDDGLHSEGGVLVIAACGADRANIARLRVEAASPRAAVEIVTVRSDAPLRPLREVLPERTVGREAPRGDAGPATDPRPAASRVARADQAARAEGAAQIDRVEGRAGPDGRGRFAVELPAGCHRLDLIAGVPASFPHRATDVDAEARAAGGHVLARDLAEPEDARLELCVGEITPVIVPFTGASGAVPVTLIHARWPLPARVPARWGPRARAAFAAAIRRHRAPDPPDPAIVEALGVQGTTSIAIEVIPGRCYLAALALTRGEAKLIRLSATTGERVARDEIAGDHADGAAVSFCAGRARRARLEADVRGASGFYTLAIWPAGTAAP